MKLIKLIIGVLSLQVGVAFASTAPNLVGNWEAVSGYWSFTGSVENPAPSKLSQKPLHTKMTISEQEGSVFVGKIVRYDGELREVAGAIHPDGKTIDLSIDNSETRAILSQNNNQLSSCGTTVSISHNRAFCTIFRKVKD